MMLRCMRWRRRSRKRLVEPASPRWRCPRGRPGTAAGRRRRAPRSRLTSTSISPVGRSGLTFSALRASDHAVDAQHGLLGLPFQGLVGRGVGAGDELDDAVVVAQIDEEDAAQIPSVVQPARQAHGGADVGGAQRAAGVGTVPMHRPSNLSVVPDRGRPRNWACPSSQAYRPVPGRLRGVSAASHLGHRDACHPAARCARAAPSGSPPDHAPDRRSVWPIARERHSGGTYSGHVSLQWCPMSTDDALHR